MEAAVKDEDMAKIEENFTGLTKEIERLLDQGRQALASSWVA
jgi:hypothetical protein